jgi:hypothetical protein
MSDSPSFVHFQEQVHNALNDADLEGFAKIKSDEERVKFVARLLATKNLQLPQKKDAKGKNSEKSLEKRNEGNKAFQKGDFNTAQQLYTVSLLVADDPGI